MTGNLDRMSEAGVNKIGLDVTYLSL